MERHEEQKRNGAASGAAAPQFQHEAAEEALSPKNWEEMKKDWQGRGTKGLEEAVRGMGLNEEK